MPSPLRVRPVAVLAAACALALQFGPFAGEPRALAGPLLQAPGAGRSQETAAADRTVLRSRYSTIDFDVLPDPDAHQPRRHPAIPLELFPGITLFAAFERFDPNPHGVTWVGRVEDVPQSRVTLVYGGGLLAGSVSMPGATFRITPAREEPDAAGRVRHLIEQIDQSAFPAEAPPIEVTFTPAEAAAAAEEPMGDSHGVLDLLVVYTASAAAWAGGPTAIQNLIGLGVSETNTAFATSGMPQRVRLVHVAPVGYAETSFFSTSLTELRAGVGALAPVHALRDAHGADLVKLVVAPGTPDACGIAFLMGTVSPAFAPSAFSVTDARCISPNYTFAHELGHNMGVRHDWFVDTGVTPFSYAHGHVNPTQRFRTIMAYNDHCAAMGFNCTRLLAWANPDMRHNVSCAGDPACLRLMERWYFPGTPMGVPGGTSTACQVRATTTTLACDADARRTVATTAPVIVNFRPTVHPLDR